MSVTILLAASLVLLCGVHQAQAVAADELTFPILRDTWNATRQWRLALATGNQNSPNFTPVNCSNPALGACTSTNPPLKQDTGDLLRVSYTLATPRGADGSLLTYKGMQPTLVQIRICHTLLSSTDRAWRKKNKAYPRLSQNCPRTAATLPFNGTSTTPDLAANTGVVYWDLNKEDEIPTSTWFVMMWVWCGDQVCAFESQEGRTDVTPPLPGNFFQTDVELGITPGMEAAAIILSVIGPAFFVAYFIADWFFYKRNGRPLRPL